jgi:hypothetical protein
MRGYTTSLYADNIHTWSDILSMSGNIVILAIFYAFLGAFVSFVFYYLFDEYEPTDKDPVKTKWGTYSGWYQLYDVCVEIALIALTSFWTTYTVNTTTYIIPVRSELSPFIDSYTTGLFFMYTIFLFLNDLSNKLTFLYETYVGAHFDWLLPNEGSILDFSLKYGPRKTDSKKDDDKDYHGL